MVYILQYYISVDEILGLKNTNKYTEHNRKMNNASKNMQSSGNNLSVECIQVTEALTRITDSDANDTRNAVGGTTINLSVVQEVIVFTPKNKKDDRTDSEVIDDAKDKLPSKTNHMIDGYKT